MGFGVEKSVCWRGWHGAQGLGKERGGKEARACMISARMHVCVCVCMRDTHRERLEELEEQVGDEDAHGGVQEEVHEVYGALDVGCVCICTCTCVSLDGS